MLTIFKIFKFIFYLVLIISIATLHLSVSGFLPAPLNSINTLLLITIFLLSTNPKTKTLLFALTIAFVVELYSSTYFGILLSAFLASSMVVHWVLLNIFTNRSIYMIWLTGVMGVIIYRAWFLLIWIFINIITKTDFTVGVEFLQNLFWEALLTSTLLVLIYTLTITFGKKLRPDYIVIKDAGIYGRKKTII